MQSRRTFLRLGAGAAAVLAAAPLAAAAPQAQFEVTRSEQEWRARLSAAQFAVLRTGATERPYSSALNDEHHAGLFLCAGCDLALFSSRAKFDSRTGWPSFWAPLEHAVVTHGDTTLGMRRTEVLCRRCGGHLGHVFDDGPPPTGLRYCMNGVAMKFTPGAA